MGVTSWITVKHMNFVTYIKNTSFSELIRKEAMDKLHKVWRSLDGNSWWLIRLYYFEGRSFEEIGEIFGITKMAVSKRHRNLLVKMRELMAT